MRSTFYLIVLLLGSFASYGQQTLISKGNIRVAFQLYDQSTNTYLDINKYCEGLDDQGLPMNLILPYEHRNKIQIFFPDINRANAKDYLISRYGKKEFTPSFGRSLLTSNNRKTIANTFGFDWQGKTVPLLARGDKGGDSSHKFKITRGTEEIEFKWRVDFREIEWYILLRTKTSNDLVKYLGKSFASAFSSKDEPVITYDSWINKGFASKVDNDGLPIDPILDKSVDRIYLVSKVGSFKVTKDGKPIGVKTSAEKFKYVDVSSGNYTLVVEEPNKQYGAKKITYSFKVE